MHHLTPVSYLLKHPMEKKRLTVALDYEVWNVLQLQAKVVEMSLGRYINKLLRGHLNIQDQSIKDALLRLESQGQLHNDGDSLERAGARLNSENRTGME